MRLIVRHPCPSCITRPVCESVCNDATDYVDYMETSVHFFLMVFIALFIIFANVTIYHVLKNFLPIEVVWYIVIVPLALSYFYMFDEAQEDWESLSSHDKKFIWIMILTSGLFFPGAYLIEWWGITSLVKTKCRKKFKKGIY